MKTIKFVLVCDDKSMCLLASLDEIDAVGILAGGDDAGLAFGGELVHFLAKGVVDADGAEALAVHGDVVLGWIGIDRQGVGCRGGRRTVFFDACWVAFVFLDAERGQFVDDGLRGVRIDVVNNDFVFGGDEDQSWVT